MSDYFIGLSVKSLVYRELQPIAKKLGMKLLILDKDTYDVIDSKLQQKMKSFGISDDAYRLLQEQIIDFGAIAVLKSTKYYGAPEIVPYFSRYNISVDAIHYLNSVNNSKEKYKPWGDFNAQIPINKRMFLYWIPLSIQNMSNG